MAMREFGLQDYFSLMFPNKPSSGSSGCLATTLVITSYPNSGLHIALSGEISPGILFLLISFWAIGSVTLTVLVCSATALRSLPAKHRKFKDIGSFSNQGSKQQFILRLRKT